MEEKDEIFSSLELLVTKLESSSVLYSEQGETSVKELLASLEKCFQHGFKAPASLLNSSIFFQNNCSVNEHVSWWKFMKKILCKDEVLRISKNLKSVDSEMGWARSWLRIALNEKSLKRTLLCIEDNDVEEFYEPWAILRSPSLQKMIQLSDIIESQIKFALVIDHPDLNQSTKQNDLEDFIVARVSSQPTKISNSHKKSKKRKNQVVCLDDQSKDVKGNELTQEKTSEIEVKTIAKNISPHTSLSYDELNLNESGDVEDDEDQPLFYSPRLTPIKNVEIGTLTPIKYDTLHSSSEENSSGKDEDIITYEKGTKSEKDELKSHLLSVLDSKEELKNQLCSLKLILDNENRKVASLKNELDITKRNSKERDDKKDARISILSRENELLKHQLKKYVGAVQRLQDGPRAYEVLSKMEKDSYLESNYQPYVDYHYEASEYEKKLVQVAEMHGELLEFNESLQRNLNSKDSLLRRYRQELIQLRGPIELDGEANLEDTSDQISIESYTSARPLISIWIPSVFLSGIPSCNPSSSKHHVYQVYLRIGDEEWNVYRRYSEFYILNKHLKKQESQVGSFDFPPKKSLGYRTEKVVEDRKTRLQTYLRKVINLMIKKNSSLADRPSKETLVRLLPFFGEHRVSRDFHAEVDVSNLSRNIQSPSIFSRQRNQPGVQSVPQLAL